MKSIQVYSDRWYTDSYKEHIRRSYKENFTDEVVNIIFNGEIIGKAEAHVCHNDGVRITNRYGAEI